MEKEERIRLWREAMAEIKSLLASRKIEHKSALGRALGIPVPTVQNWFSSKETVPHAATVSKVVQYLKRFKENTHHTPQQSIDRKTKLIAEHLESVLPLMEWFVNNGSEKDRDHLRSILGTDLSYGIFNASRALLTEMHHSRVLAEQDGGNNG